MTYSIIQPPFTLRFRAMPTSELKKYERWFLEVIPSRVSELERAVRSGQKFEYWRPDHSLASVETLGLWLLRQVETRPRPVEEIEQIKGATAFNFDVSGEELTNKTFSLAMDVGMYFGESLRCQHPHLEWHQPLKSKRFADFGQMVLLGFGQAALNPIRVVVTFCYGIATHRQTNKRLGEIYEYWSRLADETGKAVNQSH